MPGIGARYRVWIVPQLVGAAGQRTAADYPHLHAHATRRHYPDLHAHATLYAHGTSYPHGGTSYAHGGAPYAHGGAPYAHGGTSYAHGTTPSSYFYAHQALAYPDTDKNAERDCARHMSALELS
ncbi:MAG: hypothetical protein AMJ93_11695 [Anaerolineae bacterium SM23_84]|jgi:hypothetical protein|nr:MAG: hypothetical protein AMJ93_11695 [Anaerolineae bacterium SM23_84]